MKKLFIMILVGLLPILGHSQTKKNYLDSIPRFATDSTLNTFVINWLRKPESSYVHSRLNLMRTMLW